MKKTFKVVMLPTEKAINDYSLVLLPKNKLQIMSPSDMIDYLDSQSNATKRQELYILSDEEIKGGDWALDIKTNTLLQVSYIVANLSDYEGEKMIINQHGLCHNYYKDCKKIVATTDTSIQQEEPDGIGGSTSWFYPQLPESFIQAYIKAYNEGKPITEVDLEIEWWMPCPTGNFTKEDYGYKIKTRPDNTVIVHQSKMYTKDELIIFCNKAFNDSKINAITWDEWKQNNLS